MSINWVMLAPSKVPPFVPLANERTLYTSEPRVTLSLSLKPHTNSPGRQQPAFSLSCPGGRVYLTNRRIIFLPDKPTASFRSFAAPILAVSDSGVTAPWFGPNAWIARLHPTAGGGIPTPPRDNPVELKMTFKDGGTVDFHSKFEQLRERLHQAAQVARIDGGEGGAGADSAAAVHLDQLPAYQESAESRLDAPPAEPRVLPPQDQNPTLAREQSNNAAPPAEPPPGYEESQLAGLRVEMERRREQDRDDDDEEDEEQEEGLREPDLSR